MKPSEEAFQLALTGMGLPAHEVLFLDDGGSNVDAARSVGMRAHVVKNPSEIRLVLEECGVIHEAPV
jgi:FMN phosphatase YigB (HAD superfamily)